MVCFSRIRRDSTVHSNFCGISFFKHSFLPTVKKNGRGMKGEGRKQDCILFSHWEESAGIISKAQISRALVLGYLKYSQSTADHCPLTIDDLRIPEMKEWVFPLK